MKTYIFPFELAETPEGWHVSVPELEAKGAATWGHTRDEAVRNIQEVMQMVIEEMLADGEELPACVQVAEHAAAAVCV